MQMNNHETATDTKASLRCMASSLLCPLVKQINPVPVIAVINAEYKNGRILSENMSPAIAVNSSATVTMNEILLITLIINLKFNF